jgi:hypothetical protein
MSTEPRDEIEQVREVLVGALQRDLERKVARLESHFAARLAEMQQEARRRTEVIEAHLRTEADSLSGRINAELTELKEALRALPRDHRETTSAGQQRVDRVEQSVTRAQHDLRSQILDQAKAFMDELHKTREEFAETLDRELASFDGEGTVAEPTPREREQAVEQPRP